ncbi:UDP-3-O-acyl-N-acetylglucosamine deacetylase [Leptolyngbyaceae cyanobacterium CCMR0082]|uniref:UDP-3-O-acyl-N-acetylglucosamine deacetylase n=3 Tax=Adonisia TaxID=2950183 RepID=A0A6M0S192_9CYAN|nr:UDP-3-O-acyl-N-acetylglucosamine deacetylase [Adonisia turfae]NEZ58528.1 UDP-3-O-acyl-N-acetylglucosamine deacetylase [Adonisia turfae CCMR0081]NEZ61721.1 UDP-3-O-acyl-N-acetylglucosamine deacetylase [Adonisia turfae CCMR0082]
MTEGAGMQHTLAAPVTATGVGLHLGQITHVTVLPAATNVGRHFVRTDAGAELIPADVSAVSQTRLSTQLGSPEGPYVRTVEHLLAALWAAGVDNARIEIDGSEVPLMDGSSLDWSRLVQSVGTVEQESPRGGGILSEPVIVRDGDAYVMALPASELRFSYGIDFPMSAIGNQWHSWSPMAGDFVELVAPARTFAMAHQIDGLRSQGLIKGGSLENALVCDEEGWLNPPLRFANEPARHKLLDLVGDLSLLGVLPTMHVTAYRASHSLHVQLARHLAAICLSETSAPA